MQTYWVMRALQVRGPQNLYQLAKSIDHPPGTVLPILRRMTARGHLTVEQVPYTRSKLGYKTVYTFVSMPDRLPLGVS